MRAITVEDICKKLKPILGKKSDQLYLKYALSENREDREQIQRMLSVLYEKHLNTTLLDEKILLEPPRAKLIEGTYPLGTVIYADKDICTFGLREQDWPRHLCITGMSGSGKTTFAFQILGNFLLHDKPFMVFDWKKSFRPLLNLDKSIACFTIGNNQVSNFFRININRPPKGVGPKEWVSILCDLIVESFFASFGVHKVLRETLDQAFRDFGVYAGSSNYPTWRQIKDRLEEKADEMHGRRGRESEWMESALRIADSLTFGNFGDAINTKDRYGFTVEELLNRKVLFELHALGTAEKKFFCEFILSYIYFDKKFNQEGYSEKFKSAILVDEAHHIFLKDKPNFVKEGITEVVYRELREYGISLICLDQHISKLSDVVAGNSATTIAFQQILPQDVEAISGLMQMRDRRKYFSMLPVGQAIVRLAERHYEPFQIRIPFITTKNKSVPDKEVRYNMMDMAKFHKQKKSFKDWCKDDQLKKVITNLRSTTIHLNQQHKDFMHALRKKPLPTTKTYNLLKLSSRKCDSLKNDLLGQGLIEVEEVRNQRGRAKVLRLSEKGLQLLNSAGKRG